jgi:hypothetical protein
MVSRIQVAHLLAYRVLIGSLAELSFSFHRWSVLAFLQMVDAITGKVISSMVILLALKVVLHQEQGHVVAYYPCCTGPHQVLTKAFC